MRSAVILAVLSVCFLYSVLFLAFLLNFEYGWGS